MPLVTPHETALTVLYGDIERQALDQVEAFVGTPGTVIERTNAGGVAFYAHKAQDGEGKARERYIGRIGDPEAEAAAAAIRDRIEEVKGQLPRIQILRREGYAMVDARAYATIAAFHNLGIFQAGGILIGSHAYGAILNRLGVRAGPYKTHDVDLARRAALELETPLVLLDALRESGLELFEVPQLDKRQPSTSFKARGRDAFRVDLLVPSRDDTYPIVRVPELGAHATGLPLLDYLLADSQRGIVMYRDGYCGVRIPVAERYAIHKLLVSGMRAGQDKARKDLEQAAALAAAVAQTGTGVLDAARQALPKRAAKLWKKGLTQLEPLLAEESPRAWEELTG